MRSGNIWEDFLRGGYPELASDPERDVNLWYSSYMHTYLERDVRTLRQVGDLTQFQSFLRMLAAQSAKLFNMTELARDLGVAVNTIKAWLAVLEATYQITIVRPYFANVNKRLVKTPKIYFTDTGTLCHLTGLKNPDHAASGPMAGAILETAVLSELLKTLMHRGIDQHIYFWRTSSGREVDFIIETGTSLTPIEVKSSATPRPGMASGIRSFKTDLGKVASRGFVIHTGTIELPLGEGISAIPFSSI